MDNPYTCIVQTSLIQRTKWITVKPVISGHSKRILKLVFKTDYRSMQIKSILQYFQPSLSCHLSLRSLFCLFLSGRLRQVLLYMYDERLLLSCDLRKLTMWTQICLGIKKTQRYQFSLIRVFTVYMKKAESLVTECTAKTDQTDWMPSIRGSRKFCQRPPFFPNFDRVFFLGGGGGGGGGIHEGERGTKYLY